MKIGLVQFSPVWEEPEESIKIVDKLLKEELNNCEILIFPEMSLTGFTMKSAQFAEEIDGISTMYFMDLAKRNKKHIFAGIIEKDDTDIYNTVVHFDDNGLIEARYRKIHPYSHANEDKNYTAGNERVITKIGDVKVGLSVCYDLRFPELYRYYGKARTGLMINIANWPVPRIEHWKTLLKARAIENQCFMIGVNRVGADQKNNYSGCSAIFDPMGNEVIMIENKEGLFIAEIDLAKVNEVREALPFLDDIKLI
jgi:predicted amidohydrolase